MDRVHSRLASALASPLAIALALVLPAFAWAVDTGDIVATDGWYGLFYAEHVSGNQHHFGPPSAPVSQGLGAVATDANGNLYALLAYAGVVFKIDATTGAYSTVASAGYLQYPGSLCLLPGGSLIVTDHGPTGAVVGVDVASGVQTLIRPGQAYASTASASGVVHVAIPDPNALVEPACYLYRLDTTTGDTVRISNTHFHCQCNLATEANGYLIITHPSYHSIERIYPLAGGAVQMLSSGGQLVSPTGVAVESDGTIVVTDAHGLPGCDPAGGPESCAGLLFRIDPATGAQTVLSQGSYWRLGGIDIFRGGHLDTPTRGVTWGRIKTLYR
jgi:sugar lactone lactonase YvrE